jgi:hypothetical protein
MISTWMLVVVSYTTIAGLMVEAYRTEVVKETQAECEEALPQATLEASVKWRNVVGTCRSSMDGKELVIVETNPT